MQIVHVEMFEGRSLEQKRELTRAITEDVARICGVSADGVHVLLTEVSRDNWSRGALLNSDRPRQASSGGRGSLGDIVVVAEKRSEYPAAPPAGCLGMVVARGIGHATDLSFSSWASEDGWRAAGGLPEGVTVCDRMDLPAGLGLRGMPLLPRYMSVSTHTVQPAKLDEYLELRRIAVNPGMARLHGFVSSDVLRKREMPNAFFIVNQWLLKEDSDRYSDSPLHDYLKSRVRPLLDLHSGMKDFAVQTVAAG